VLRYVNQSVKFLFLIFTPTIIAQNLDWKAHDVGNIYDVVTNTWCQGDVAGGGAMGLPSNTFFFPKGSETTYQSNVDASGIEPTIAARKYSPDGNVSVTSSGPFSCNEVYPSTAEWDTIWHVQRGEIVDIPYWPGYEGLSDQDFVRRGSDYNLDPFGSGYMQQCQGDDDPHINPLFIDVITTSHAWANPPLDEFIVWQNYIIPTQDDLYDVYFGWFYSGPIGNLPSPNGMDDCVYYDSEKHLAVVYDSEGVDDGPVPGPYGLRMYPAEKRNVFGNERIELSELNVSFATLDPTAMTDIEKWDIIYTSHHIEQERCGPWDRGTSYQWLIFGPVDSLLVGDTLKLTWSEVVGEGDEGFYHNLSVSDWLFSNNFSSPSPPPSPEVSFSTASNQVTLDWAPEMGNDNPEEWQDDIRLDTEIEPQPFEGYRVYKSAESLYGPWTLLAEFDIENNDFFNNTGLSRTFTDEGLLNNIEYYYSVTSFSKPDIVTNFPSVESSISGNAFEVIVGTGVPETVGEVAVVPNPYMGDVYYNTFNPPWEKAGNTGIWMEQDRRIQFINLPSPSRLIIYTLSGDVVRTLNHNDSSKGYKDWNLTSNVGQTVASGVYLFSAEDLNNNQVQSGKFVIVK
tara:strand:- start:8122 stop:9990 length:1869 start_codon:yes stop_codon:yes gene_type:complete